MKKWPFFIVIQRIIFNITTITVVWPDFIDSHCGAQHCYVRSDTQAVAITT